MATSTYTPLATITLGSAESSVTFSSIPQTYRDLIVVISGTSSGATSPSLNFNSDSGSNYSTVRMFNSGSGGVSQAFVASYTSLGYMDTNQTTIIANIMDYSATDKHTTVISRGSNTTTLRAEAGRWANTSAVTSVQVRMDGGQTYSSGTTISLYGIEA